MNGANDTLAELGRRLAARRREAGVKAEELAASAGIDPARLALFESGEGGLGAVALSRLADRLGVPGVSFLHTKAPIAKAPPEPIAMLLAHRSARLTAPDYDALVAGLRRARAFHEVGVLLSAKGFAAEFKPSPPPEKNAHLDGYRRALKARSMLVAFRGPVPAVRRLIEDQFDILIIEHRFTDPGVFGASCRSGVGRLIVVNATIDRASVRRFVSAHELGHHLSDLGSEGLVEDHGLTANARFWFNNPPAEKRANAFAAMFLAPEPAVRDLLGPPRAEGYGLDAARDLVGTARAAFGVGFAAMAWHLYNLKYIRSDETVKDLLAFPDPNEVVGFDDESRFDGLERRVLEAFHRELITRSRATEILGRPVDDLLG
jgi:Zn-dependent peptidase ImmA (M78 family)/transcriptional regulator with XRE-family HTH domain